CPSKRARRKPARRPYAFSSRAGSESSKHQLDALPPHAVAARYTRSIRTHHNATPSPQQSRRGCGRTGGLALAPQRLDPTDVFVGAVEPGCFENPQGPTPPSYTRASLLGTSPVLFVEPRPAYIRHRRSPPPSVTDSRII